MLTSSLVCYCHGWSVRTVSGSQASSIPHKHPPCLNTTTPPSQHVTHNTSLPSGNTSPLLTPAPFFSFILSSFYNCLSFNQHIQSIAHGHLLLFFTLNIQYNLQLVFSYLGSWLHNETAVMGTRNMSGKPLYCMSFQKARVVSSWLV